MKIFYKLLIAAGILGGAIWFGGTVLRLIVAFDMFVPGTLNPKPGLSVVSELQSIRLYAIMALSVFVGYAFAVASTLAAAIAHRNTLRNNGWAVISLLLFFLAMPIELYLAVSDIPLIKAAGTSYSTEQLLGQSAELKLLFFQRFSQSSTQLLYLTMAAYSTIVLFCVFRPLSRNSE